MSRRVDITGQRFGRFVVIRPAGSNGRRALWECRCDCGKTAIVVGKEMRSGNTKSCGCLQADNRWRHGKSRDRIYRIWQAMMQRCYNPKNTHWEWYGGRGISVCERWHDPAMFIADMIHDYAPDLTIDRYPNNDGNYSPDNCRWATLQQQRQTQRKRGKNRR